jgi:hypothetical protein
MPAAPAGAAGIKIIPDILIMSDQDAFSSPSTKKAYPYFHPNEGGIPWLSTFSLVQRSDQLSD